MSSYRLLVTDVDGTLVGRSLRPSLRVSNALDAVRAAGWRIAMCTGRGPQGCAGLAAMLHMEGYHIFHNGALVSDVEGKQVLSRRPLPTRLANQVIDSATSAGLTLELYTAEGYYVAQRNWLTDLHGRSIGVMAEEADLPAIAAQDSVIKAEIVVADGGHADAVQRLRERFSGQVGFEAAPLAGTSDVVCINVVDHGVSKASGMLSLAQVYGIPLEEVVAVGDGPNDVPILQAAGLGVAMGNASDAVKRQVGVVTDDVESDGLAKLLEQLLG